jgi:membrane protease YdiL (CAAX protease family)
MVNIDLWKRKDFRIKDAVLLCLFELGICSLAGFLLRLFRINLGIVYDIAGLGIVLAILRQFGKKTLPAVMKRRKVPAAAVCSLIVMFFGMKILLLAIAWVLWIILPVPEGFFDTDLEENVLMTIISGAVFPAFTEEVFFRGILLTRLRRRYPQRTALAVSALLFGLAHLNPWQALTAFIAGLFLGWIYMKYKTIWLCIFFHAYNNVLASFMPFPGMQPLLVILGALMFLAGWGLTALVPEAPDAEFPPGGKTDP